MQLDKWQEDVLNTNGNIVLRSGRQVGKSTVISIKSAEYAVLNAKKSIMIISATERQAYLLFSKVLGYIHDNYKSHMKAGKDRPTKSEIKLKNGSIIRCLPTGTDGLGIRGYTVDLLIADEAAFIPQDVWPAVTPMLSTTGGTQILLSTPFGKEGYFYDCFNDDGFTKFHISTPEIAEQRKEPQKSSMIQHLEQEKKRMTQVQFAQEYLGEFVDELMQLFPDSLIKSRMLNTKQHAKRGEKYYMGVDVARFGGDEITFEIFRKVSDENITQVENIFETNKDLMETVEQIKRLDVIYDFKRDSVGIDTGGLGVGVFDFLRRDKKYEMKLVDMNNAKRTYLTSIDKKGKEKQKKKTLLKEDMYINLKVLMEKGAVSFLDEESVFFSLKSVQYEHKEDGTLKIFGNNTHIAEGIIRAVMLAVGDKSFKLWVDYI